MIHHLCYINRKKILCQVFSLYKLLFAFSEINPSAVLKDFEMESAADRAFVNMVRLDMTEYAMKRIRKSTRYQQMYRVLSYASKSQNHGF